MGEAMKYQLKVRHYEVDSYGHVNHTHYVHYLEVGRIEALEAVGLSLAEMHRQGYSIFATELSVRYHAPAHSGETLEVVTSIRKVRGARSTWVQEIREASSQRLLVTAEVIGAFVAEGGRPVRVPAGFSEKLSGFCVSDAEAPARAVEDAVPSAPAEKSRPWCVCGGGSLGGTLRRLVG